MARRIKIRDASPDRHEGFGDPGMKRSKLWKKCFRQASRHRKTHAGFDRALHACLARQFGDYAPRRRRRGR